MTISEPRSTPSRSRAARGAPPLGAVLGRGDTGFSLLLIFPLFLVYEVGVVFAPVQNGVDFVTRNLMSLVGYDRGTYLLVHLAFAVVFLGLLLVLRRRRRLRGKRVLPVLLESAIYALTMGSLIIFVMQKLIGFDTTLAVSPTVERLGNSVVLSLGAGVHEELVFRLGLLAGGAALLRKAGVNHVVAVLCAFILSSAAFSAAHHIGALGDPWRLTVFVYRLLAGLAFAALFYFRSLAHAVYTHAFYDIYVLVLQ